MLIFRSAQENIYANSIEYRQSKIKQNVTHDNVLYNQKIVYKKELNVIYRIGIGVLAFLGYATVVPYCLYSKKIALWWKQAVKGVDKKIVLILNGTSKKSVRFNDNVQIILFKKDNLSKIKSDEIRSNNAIPKESNHLIIPHTTVEPIIQMAPFLNFIQDISTKYSEMKRRLVDAVQSGDVKCTFDDQAYSFTFYHSPEEIKAIIKKYSLEEVSGNVSFDPNSCATMRGEAFIQMNSKQPKTKESLIKDSRLFFKTRQIQNIEIEKEDQSQNPEEMFAKLLKKNNGICIGEMHHDEAPKKFLIKNMAQLKKQGVTTLYLEHFHYNTTTQKLFDRFMESKNNEMPGYLKELLCYMDCGFHLHGKEGNFTSLVIAAKKAGIRIVAIDTAMSYSCGTERKLGVTNQKERYEGMNGVATVIIEENQKKAQGKYIALMGSGHLTTHVKEDAPGVAELLGVPSVIIEHTEKEPSIDYRKKSEPLLTHLSAYVRVN